VAGVLLEDVCLSLCSTLLDARPSMQTRAVIASLLARALLSYASFLRVCTERSLSLLCEWLSALGSKKKHKNAFAEPPSPLASSLALAGKLLFKMNKFIVVALCAVLLLGSVNGTCPPHCLLGACPHPRHTQLHVSPPFIPLSSTHPSMLSI
jgi:hypothetical protein